MRKDLDHTIKKSANIVPHLTDAAKPDSKCYFCDENENHIATRDLNNIKLYITLHVKNS